MRTFRSRLHPKNAFTATACFAACGVLACVLFSGCEAMPEPDRGAHQSLVEIGERALERAEELEDEGRRAEANVQYKRALWAFTYHERLTGEEPFLLDDALNGRERTAPR